MIRDERIAEPAQAPTRPVPGPRRRWVALAMGAAVAVSALLAFGLTRDPRALPSALVGERAPDFSLRDMDTGEVVGLRDFRGQVVVVNFWASWCVACREEHPNFVGAWDRYRDRGVVFLGILYEDTPANAQAYMRELGGDWPSLLDPGSRTAIDYGVYGVPETFFVDREGRIAHKRVGATSYEELVAWVERLLQGRGAAAGGG